MFCLFEEFFWDFYHFTAASSQPATCNFESTNICAYTQDKTSDKFDWRRASGSTGSRGTGPSNDHTYGTRNGMDLYSKSWNLWCNHWNWYKLPIEVLALWIAFPFLAFGLSHEFLPPLGVCLNTLFLWKHWNSSRNWKSDQPTVTDHSPIRQ